MDEKKWFAQIFSMHYDHIRNYLYYLSGDITLAEDLSQDAFLQIWHDRNNVSHETVRSYLFTIAKNQYLKYYRRKSIQLNFTNSLILENDNESPEYVIELKEFDLKLQGALAKLPDKTRAVFLMSRIDSMSYKEIAASLTLSEKAIEKHISKALKYLAENVDKNIKQRHSK